MKNTIEQYNSIASVCREVYVKKMKDYGTAWRIMRLPSITDQIFIKAQRIRTLDEVTHTMVDEDARAEFIGIINYAIIGLIQLERTPAEEEMDPIQALELYNHCFARARSLMEAKNHDYGEAWRKMRVGSFTDLILMKIKRTKQIEDNKGKTLVSEGIDANYLDMINYAVFALIKIDFEKN